MKLNKKGLKRLLDVAFDGDEFYQSNALEVEFEPNDFQDAVILTVEEANLLFKVIDGFFDLKLPTTKEIVALNKLKVRVERIEQAEKKDE